MDDLTSARVLADSTYINGTRLVTVEAVFPRCILAEVNTHKDPSRNSASSRAIPVEKQIQKIMDNPWVPTSFPMNQPGMTAVEDFPIGGPSDVAARQVWLWAREQAVNAASRLQQIGVHKQITNRLLEPFMWHTAIITATREAWGHIFALRCHPSAQPQFQTLAGKIRDAIDASQPCVLDWDQWHLPLIGFPGDEKLSVANQIRVSVGRVARVSYLTHAGTRDVDADIALFERLADPGDSPPHASPAEHQAMPSTNPRMYANFEGWVQARKLIELGAPFPGEA